MSWWWEFVEIVAAGGKLVVKFILGSVLAAAALVAYVYVLAFALRLAGLLP